MRNNDECAEKKESAESDVEEDEMYSRGEEVGL